MELRERIAAALRDAADDPLRSATLRLVAAAIRDRDKSLREEGREATDGAELRAILSRLAAQRRASAEAFELAGRLQQAAQKTAEAEVIEALLPRRMTEAEVAERIEAVVTELGASSLQDIGQVMAALRPRLGEQVDPAALKAMVRARLV